jgi:hypothetical protein
MTLLTDAMISPVDSIQFDSIQFDLMLCVHNATRGGSQPVQQDLQTSNPHAARGGKISLRRRNMPDKKTTTAQAVRRTFCGGGFMLTATISHAKTNPEHAKNTALCPSTFSSQPPITPPMARPIDCVVL